MELPALGLDFGHVYQRHLPPTAISILLTMMAYTSCLKV
jgi:hypothetical protein